LFFDEHVEADSVHDMIATYDLAGSLAQQEPTLSTDIVFGARALRALDERWTRRLLDSWRAGRTSLLDDSASASTEGQPSGARPLR
jgi:hypothetical protein